MLGLAWANLMHHRLRTVLSALAVGLGIMLFLVSKGLASGSIGEVAERMRSVEADLLILPAQENTIFVGGAVFPPIFERFLREKVADERGPLAAAVMPVFWHQIRMGGQQQRLFGVDPMQLERFLGPRALVAGAPFVEGRQLAERVAALRVEVGDDNVADLLTDEERQLGFELVIDDRLARVGERGAPYEIGDSVQFAGRRFTIVGIVEAGSAGRVFAPLQTLQNLFNSGEAHATMFFVQVREGLDPARVADRYSAELGDSAQIHLASNYGQQLRADFAQVDMYMTATSGLALTVCFLFILLTMYTFVLERTREIGVLKALGMTRSGLIGLSVVEALLISCGGVLIGIGLSFGAQALLAWRLPLLTVALPVERMAVALVIGVLGGTGSALYPGWRAARLDPAQALGYE